MNIHEIEQLYIQNHDFIISIDEAGRGPWAGPVTVGAVVVDKQALIRISELKTLNDSKKVSSKKRAILEKEIMDIVNSYTVADIDVSTIDRINILEATKLGVITCLDKIMSEKLWRAKPIISIGILIDGKFNNLESLIKELASFSNIKFELNTVIDGDAICPSISAASILAKEHRDNLMIKLHKEYPEYGFNQHKGYGTKLHQKRLKMFGPSKIHRKSFKPIKEALLNQIL